MRIVVLVLSVSSVFFFGRALGALGGYMVGRPHPALMVQGLAGGVVTALLALWLWRNRLRQESKK